MAFSITLGGMTFTEANFEGSAYAQETTGFAKALEKVVQHVADAFRGEASDLLTVGLGSKALTILNASGQVPAFAIGMPVRIARTSDPSNTYMQGEVTAWDGNTGAATINVTAIGGVGTFSDWTVTVGGMIATVTGSPLPIVDGGTAATTAAGARVNLGVGDQVVAKSAGYSVVVGDRGQLHTQSGSYTVTLPAAATVGDGWSITIVNIGSGTITIDGNAAETINGAPTYVMGLQYVALHLVCDGSNWITGTHPSLLSEGALFGLGLSNRAAQPGDDIIIAVGNCFGTPAAGSPAEIKLAATLIKQIDFIWVAGNDAGGRSSSVALTADTWYHVFAIIVAGIADAGFDTSLTAANLIADHSATHYRRIGSVLTDGAANIIGFFQSEDTFLWKSPPLDINVINQGTTGLSRLLSTPPGVRLLAIVNHSIDHATGNVIVNFQSGGANDEAPSRTNAPLGHTAGLHDGATNFRDISSSLVLTNTSSTISSRSSASSTSLYLVTVGWFDTRGRLS